MARTSLSEELRIMVPNLSKFDTVYTLCNDSGLYRAYYRNNFGSVHDSSGDLLRLEGNTKRPEVVEYNLVGGINPSEWQRSPFKKNIVSRISDGKSFNGIGEICRPPSQIYVGDQLVVQTIPDSKKRNSNSSPKTLIFSGVICRIDDLLVDFQKYAKRSLSAEL